MCICVCVVETGWVEGGKETHLYVRVCVFACVCVCPSHTTNTRTHTHTHTHTHSHGARTHTHTLFHTLTRRTHTHTHTLPVGFFNMDYQHVLCRSRTMSVTAYFRCSVTNLYLCVRVCVYMNPETHFWILAHQI